MDEGMGKNAIQHVIATRDLWFIDKHGQVKPIKVLMGVPEQIGPHDYVCHYQILGVGDERIRGMEGEDSVQALVLTLSIIGAEFFALRELHGRKIWWFNENDPNLGFPLPESLKHK